jgi:hypothetical protein
VSDINMDSEKVEGLCFPLLIPHAKHGYTNASKSCLNPDEYVMARFLRPEKIGGQYMTAIAAHEPYLCIDSQTEEPFAPNKDPLEVEVYQVPDISVQFSMSQSFHVDGKAGSILAYGFSFTSS